MIELLAKKGANLNCRGMGSSGGMHRRALQTPLTVAVETNQPKIVKVLLTKGAKPNLDCPLSKAIRAVGDPST